MESHKFGVCVIGAGRAGLIHAVNFAKKIKNARLTAIVDPNRETAEQACRELELDLYYTATTPAWRWSARKAFFLSGV
jgi:predicted dehydrogenase